MPIDLQGAIKDELRTALERLGAHRHLLAILGSWGDTLDDAAVLELLKDWNAGEFEMDMIATTSDAPRPKSTLRRVK